MDIKQEIEKLLHENLTIQFLQVINKSHEHYKHEFSPKNGQSHFHLILEADDFKECNKLECQRKVYHILKDVIKKIHAISMNLS